MAAKNRSKRGRRRTGGARPDKDGIDGITNPAGIMSNVPAEVLERSARDLGLGAFLFSNPCNPTGALVQGEELKRYVALSRKTGMALLADEFYSHFICSQAWAAKKANSGVTGKSHRIP